MTNNKQEIQSKQGCNNIQANGNITIVLMSPEKHSPEEVQNALTYLISNQSNAIGAIAQQKFEEKQKIFDNTFIQKLLKLPQEILYKFCSRIMNPSMLMSLLEAKKSYTRSDDENKLEQLIGLLIEKGTENSETLKDFLCTKALEIVPFINEKQLDFLSFLTFKNATILGNKTPGMKWVYEENLKHFIDFSDSLNLSIANFNYLMQLDLIEKNPIRVVGSSMINNIIRANRHLYTVGFTKEQFLEIMKEEEYLKYTRLCCYDNNLLQVDFVDETDFMEKAQKDNTLSDKEEEFKNLMNKILQSHQVEKIFDEIDPNINEVMKKGAFTDNYHLTPLGTLMALKNIELKLGIKIGWPFD